MTVRWGEKRYYSLDYYLKTTYGEKLYKISLDGGMTCPNRDGTLGTRGCIFCSRGGSGDFAESHTLSVTEQIESGKKSICEKIIPDHPTSLISRHTPILMLLLHIWKKVIYGSHPAS